MTTATENRLETLEALDPKDLSDQELYDYTLEWTNLIRAEYNLPALDKLPAAAPRSSSDCTLARALRGLSDHSCDVPGKGRYSYVKESGALMEFSYEGKIRNIVAPEIVGEFARRFDNLEYPNLITWT